jgi:hypothetical protein
MPTTAAGSRTALLSAGVIAALVAGFGLGRLTASPQPTTPAAAVTASPTDHTHAPGTAPHSHDPAGTTTQAGTDAGGLAISSGGYTLVPGATAVQVGQTQDLTFRITGTDQQPVTTFAVVHEKPLHLIVVRADLTGFQHLHPTMAPDGTWSIDLTLAAPGSYRAIADFTAIVGGSQVAATLGADLTVAGNYAPVALPAPVQQATTDGFQVGYEGTPRVESTQPLLVTVTAPDGKPAALEPYLGSYGHLVVLREGDVGYLHVHPEAELVAGKVRFWLAAPGPGRYRMFFDFQVAGRVHTAAWSLTVS